MALQLPDQWDLSLLNSTHARPMCYSSEPVYNTGLSGPERAGPGSLYFLLDTEVVHL